MGEEESIAAGLVQRARAPCCIPMLQHGFGTAVTARTLFPSLHPVLLRQDPATCWGTTRLACCNPVPHLDDGLHPAGRAGGGPAGSLHCVRTEAPGDVRHGLGETEMLV